MALRPQAPHLPTLSSSPCCAQARSREIRGTMTPSRYLALATALSYPPEQQEPKAVGLGGGGGGGKERMGVMPSPAPPGAPR